MKTRAWLPLSFAALAVVLPAAAQDASQEVLLQFKHQAGQSRKYRFQMKADFTVTPDGNGAGGLGALPIGLKSTAFFTEKVASVDGQVASLLVTPLTMTMDTSLLGMSTVLKMERGKLTVNGQPLPPGSNLGGLEGMLAGKPLSLQRNAQGQLAAVAADATGISQMLNSSFLLQLPEGPVKVGDTWETAMKGAAKLPVGGPLQPQLPDMELKLTHTLKSLETSGGKLHALIETKGGATSSAGENKDAPMGQTYSGVTRFDVNQGAILSGKYSADIKMKVPVPTGLGTAPPAAPEGAPTPEGMPASMQLDGIMSFTLGEAPMVPAQAAPKATKPAVRKPAVRKPAVKKPAARTR